MVSPYSYCTGSDFAVHFPLLAGAYRRWRSSVYSVQGRDRTVAVQGHCGTVQQLYGDTDDRKKSYSTSRSWSNCCEDKIGSGTWFYNSLYADTDDCKNKSRPVEADPTVEKTLGTVLCSSRDGVPLKFKKENGRPGSFKIPIDWYHFRPLLPVVGQYL